ncbi:nucleotide sugar dehydrogenase [Mycolicibacterium chubuense]|uniref:nucleotide sugar dehydrogenase n=1 Tax=Mycolicibacterium chubuense TaxID=1800 RepID=UPI0002EBCC14|nr:nucleotide sugar dehydrogenase [Mycolicibacterium chubuense]
MQPRQRVAVVGLGYVGLPTALSLTAAGSEVVGIDVDENRLAAIKDERVELFHGDASRLATALNDQLLKLTTEPATMKEADAVVICVPTPVDAHTTPDMTALSRACETVVEHAQRGQTIVLTSTTYAGCTRDLLIAPLRQRGFQIGTDVFVAFSPERIDPGVAGHAPESTPRVLGGFTGRCSERAARLLAHTAAVVHIVSSPEAAEMTKLLENTFRAVNIALANEFADAATELGIDVIEVISAASTKPYGYMPFYPGSGVGGHCIPCDPHYLLWQMRARRRNSPVVDAAMAAIAARPRAVFGRAVRVLADSGKPLTGARILIAGVSYKPGISDIRESPALAIIDLLSSQGAHVFFSDPYVDVVRSAVAGTLHHVANPDQMAWDLVVVHTAHPDHDLGWLAQQPTVLDASYKLADLPNRHLL